ncbi:MAG: alcohol dehydrogenase catalytic domain-containing protein [Chitinivibrionales bacterium]|nr:alcohol dehydrogenase catalytic domain-containing protein [Chitinivibrionales bacterium]
MKQGVASKKNNVKVEPAAFGIIGGRKTMAAAIFEAPQRVKVKAVPVPEVKEDQVRIKIEGCGLCGSNLPVWQGLPWLNYPFAPGAPGHEAWGYID